MYYPASNLLLIKYLNVCFHVMHSSKQSKVLPSSFQHFVLLARVNGFFVVTFRYKDQLKNSQTSYSVNVHDKNPDRVGHVDNRPSNDKVLCFVKK